MDAQVRSNQGPDRVPRLAAIGAIFRLASRNSALLRLCRFRPSIGTDPERLHRLKCSALNTIPKSRRFVSDCADYQGCVLSFRVYLNKFLYIIGALIPVPTLFCNWAIVALLRIRGISERLWDGSSDVYGCMREQGSQENIPLFYLTPRIADA